MIDRIVLSNGLSVLYLHTPQDPIAACHLFFPQGALIEPAEKAGVTTLFWSLFTKGTLKRSSKKIAEDLEMMGASLGAGATYDYSEISCHATSDQAEKTLAIMAECLRYPLFDETEISKEKTALQAAIRSKQESIFTITHESLNHHLFPRHPYGRPASGTEKSVAHLTSKDLVACRNAIVQPQGTVLSMASDIPFDKIILVLEQLFGAGAWSSVPFSQPSIEPLQILPADVQYKSNSHFEQAYLMMGFSAASVQSEDYIPLKVLNAILGGGMSTRLFQSLREKEGLAYDVGSFYSTKRWGGAFVVHMGLQASRLTEAKHGILRELNLLQKVVVPERELTQVKNQLTGSFILDHQTNSHRAHYLGWWEILGLGAAFDKDYPSKVEAVSAAQIHAIAGKYFARHSITIETIPGNKSSLPEPVTHVF